MFNKVFTKYHNIYCDKVKEVQEIVYSSSPNSRFNAPRRPRIGDDDFRHCCQAGITEHGT